MIGENHRIVDPHALAESLTHDTAGIAILEVRKEPADEGFRAGHVPGAQSVYWKDFAWSAPRRAFPSPETMAKRLSSLGIGNETPVVVYGDAVQFGVYVAWVIEMAGHRNVSVLDGGKDYWLNAGLPVSSRVSSPAPVPHAPGRSDRTSRIGRDELLNSLGDPDLCLVDVRSDQEYVGERVTPPTAEFDHGATRKGHIPGARHFFFKNFLEENSRFRDAVAIRQDLAAAEIDVDRSLVTYCRMGHRGAMSRYVLKHVVGVDDVRVYDGSWTEWGSLADVPIATGYSPGV